MQADILAGFDGIHSVVRDIMLQKETEKEHLGMGAWRFYIELPDYTFEDATFMYRSGDTQIGVVPLAEHAGYVFVLQPCTSDYWDEEDTRFDRVKEILSSFRGWILSQSTCQNSILSSLTNWSRSPCRSHGIKAASSSEETPPTPARRPWRKERQWRSRMPSSSPKNSKTTPTTKQHYRRTTKEEPHERSKSRTYHRKSSAVG